MLNRKQLSVVHVAKAHLGLDDEDYRALLRRVGGVKSCTELDALGFELLMDEFRRLGFESDHHRRNFGERPGMASAAQVAFIRALWYDWSGREDDDAGLGKWLERTFKCSSIRFLPAEAAPKAITALLAMNRRRAAKEELASA